LKVWEGADPLLSEKRMSNAPLVPDADKLEKELVMWKGRSDNTWEVIQISE